MVKVGIDDILARNGPEILPRLLKEAWRFDGYACPRAVHLSDIEDAALGRRRLCMDLMVSAVGETYLLPRTIELLCRAPEAPRRRPGLRLAADHGERLSDEEAPEPTGPGPCAHLAQNDGRWDVDITAPEILIDLTRLGSRSLGKRLQEIACQHCPGATYARAKTHQTVTSFLATPKAKRLRSLKTAGGVACVDDGGKPFRQKVLYYLGNLDGTARYFRAVGIAIPSPKSQEATAFLWSLTPLADDHETFDEPCDLQEPGRSPWARVRSVQGL